MRAEIVPEVFLSLLGKHMRYKRKRLLVDGKVQGGLLIRVAAYWMACVFTVEFLSLGWEVATGPEQPSYFAYIASQDWGAFCLRVVISALVLVPISWDMLRLSNRFAGPIFRMQRILREVAANGIVQPIRLRDGDYCEELARDLNAALSRLASDAELARHAAAEEEPCLEHSATQPLA